MGYLELSGREIREMYVLLKDVSLLQICYYFIMKKSTLEQLRYPIGHFVKPVKITSVILKDWLAELEALPVKLKDMVEGLSDKQLDTPYRPDGWTVRQVTHHLADSHHHSYTRFKWALTEEQPVIKAYDEKSWAELPDSKNAPVSPSLDHLKAIHTKLIFLLSGLNHDEFKRTFVHPASNKITSLEENTGIYAWHGNHHLAHIENLLISEGWRK